MNKIKHIISQNVKTFDGWATGTLEVELPTLLQRDMIISHVYYPTDYEARIIDVTCDLEREIFYVDTELINKSKDKRFSREAEKKLFKLHGWETTDY